MNWLTNLFKWQPSTTPKNPQENYADLANQRYLAKCELFSTQEKIKQVKKEIAESESAIKEIEKQEVDVVCHNIEKNNTFDHYAQKK